MITNMMDANNKSSLHHHHHQSNQHESSNVKLKRCKHGRIIIKDRSKKRDEVPQQSSRTSNSQPNSSQPPSSNHFSPRAAAPQIEPSLTEPPASARSPVTPSNDSTSSDIYDPEGSILSISPVESPPSSPFSEAAYSSLSFHKIEVKNGDDDVPSSAVQLNQQEKYLQKLNRQERVIEEVKIALKPHYLSKVIHKNQYKDVLRRAVPKVSFF